MPCCIERVLQYYNLRQNQLQQTLSEKPLLLNTHMAYLMIEGASTIIVVYETRHYKTGQLSVTKKNVIFLLSERAFY